MSDWREYVRVYQVRVLRLGCVGLEEICRSLSVSREEVVLHQVLGKTPDCVGSKRRGYSVLD